MGRERCKSAAASGAGAPRGAGAVCLEATPPSASFLDRMRAAAIESDKLELRRLLREHGGNVAAVARALSMSRSGVLYRCQKYGLR